LTDINQRLTHFALGAQGVKNGRIVSIKWAIVKEIWPIKYIRGMNPAVVNILLSGLFMALMNLLVKWSGEYNIFQIIFFRSVVTLIISYLFILKKGISPLGNDKKHLILRGLFGFGGLSLYFLTVQHIPLATAVSIQYLSPVFTALLAIYINKQKSPWYTWLFYVVAMGGVILIKGYDPRVDLWMLLAGIASAIFSGAAYNMIRRIGKQDDPDVVVFYFPLVTLPLVIFPAIYFWIWPADIWQWLILIGVGVTTQFGQVYMTRAFQMSDLGGIAIFQYFGLVYALAFGFFFFDEGFGWMTYMGMFLIVGGAIGNAMVNITEKIKN